MPAGLGAGVEEMEPARENEETPMQEKARITPPAFRTLTSEDWRRSIADARARPNGVLMQLRMTEVKLGLRPAEARARLN